MSHIVGFKIAGLAGRKDVLTAKLDRHINVFFGLNGTGKTSLLRILDAAMNGEIGAISNVPFQSAEVTIHSVQYNMDFVRTIDKRRKKTASSRRLRPQTLKRAEEEVIVLGEFVSPKGTQLEWKTKPSDPDTSETHWRHIYLPTWRLYAGTETARAYVSGRGVTAMEREYDWERYFGQKLEELWLSCSNQILSEVGSIREQGVASILEGILSPRPAPRVPKGLAPEAAYDRVRAFLKRGGTTAVLGSRKDFINRYATDKLLKRAVSDINILEQKIEKAMRPRQELERLITTMFSGNKNIVFTDASIMVKTDKEQDIGLASLSSGEKHMVCIFIDAILAAENALLIDEPEISLHIDWQKMLIQSMRQVNSNAQLILATHSPEIMAYIDDENIFQL